jgi:hypothetical protein
MAAKLSTTEILAIKSPEKWIVSAILHNAREWRQSAPLVI